MANSQGSPGNKQKYQTSTGIYQTDWQLGFRPNLQLELAHL